MKNYNMDNIIKNDDVSQFYQTYIVLKCKINDDAFDNFHEFELPISINMVSSIINYFEIYANKSQKYKYINNILTKYLNNSNTKMVNYIIFTYCGELKRYTSKDIILKDAITNMFQKIYNNVNHIQTLIYELENNDSIFEINSVDMPDNIKKLLSNCVNIKIK